MTVYLTALTTKKAVSSCPVAVDQNFRQGSHNCSGVQTTEDTMFSCLDLESQVFYIYISEVSTN